MDNRSVVSLLDSLTETCINLEAQLRDCSDLVDSDTCRRCLDGHAKSCALVVNELQQMVRSLGGAPTNARPLAGALRQQWLDVANMLSLTSDSRVLRECLRCEVSTGFRYRDALAEDLPASIRLMLERQHLILLRCQDESKSLSRLH